MKLIYIHGNYIDSYQANVVQAIDMAQSFAYCGADTILALGAPRTKQANYADMLEKYLGEKPAFKFIEYKKLKIFGKLEILGNFWGIRSLLKKHGADVCFVDDVLILKLCLDAGIPTIFESHQSVLHNTSKWWGSFWEKQLLENIKNRKLLKMVTISNALTEFWISRGVPGNKIITCHDGINHATFENIKRQSDARRTLQLPENKKIAVYAGNLQHDRGIDRIIGLAKFFSDVLFIVVGGPENRRQYFQNLSDHELVSNIVWVGQTPHANVPDYLYAADILLMLWTWDVPTIKVCSPLKVFEYMAAERVIVGDAFPTIKEILDETTAFLAKPGEFVDLCKKFSQALEQDYPSEMAVKARKLVMQEYTWINRAQKILDSLDSLL